MSTAIDVQPIETLLSARVGLDPASIGRDAIAHGLGRRMKERGCRTVSEYLSLVGQDEEWDELVELVLVGETWFFREPTAFALLEERARRHAVVAPRRIFRALSMPCSTGAEPYSMAMSLRAAGLSPDRFRVEAVDLSRHALALARDGVYDARAVRHVPPPVLEAHFTRKGDQWAVTQSARRGVHFSRGNLVDRNLLRGSTRFDVVFCRNVLIYLGQPGRQQLLETLSRLLRDDGVLVTGHAETTNVVSPRFVWAGVPRTFAYVRSTGSESALSDPRQPERGSPPAPDARSAKVTGREWEPRR